MMHNAEILMIFPRLGSEDVFVKDVPLGLLYASTNAIKKGFLLRLLDLRLYDNWERAVRTSITPDLKIVGIDDLKKTADIMIRLLQDNPHCVIGIPNKYNPYPGADLFDRAVESGMKRPENIEEWIKYDSVANDNYFSWYTTECNHFIKMMQFTAYFADRKLEREVAGKYLFGCFIRSFSHIYYPIAYWRLKHKCDKLLIEGSLLRVFESALRKSCQRHQGHARPSGN